MFFQQVENFTTRPEDVIIASFPKSGTTWAQEIVHQISMIHASKQVKKDTTSLISEVNIKIENLLLIF